MKSIRFDISLYIIIPVIFSGIALLSIIVAYHLTHYYMAKGVAPEWPLVIFGICMIILNLIFMNLSIITVVIKYIIYSLVFCRGNS